MVRAGTLGKSKSSKGKLSNAQLKVNKAKSVGISVGGKNKVVREGGESYNKYMSQGGVVSQAAKTDRKNQLRGMSGSSPIDDEGNEIPGDVLGAETMAPELPAITPQQADIPSEASIAGAPKATTPTTPRVPTAQPTPAQQGYQAAVASGLPAPTSAGAARTAVQQYTPPVQTASPLDTALEADEGYQSILQAQRDFQNQENKRGTLVQEYQKLVKSAGIDEINTDLINMKNVIEGTEDDIRNEVTAAGGFATNSQVMAMSSARNKSLIQNYNTLLETKNAQMEHIDQMMSFSQQDRQYAQQKLTNDLGFIQMEQSYRAKFMNNAKEGYQQIIAQRDYDGLYNSISSDPKLVANAEKILGLQSGQLKQLGSQKSLDRQIKEAQLSNIYSEINQRAMEGQFPGLTPAQINQTVNQVAGAFDNEPTVKEFNTIKRNVLTYQNLGTSATDDIQRVYTFAKVADPNSAVKEGEYNSIEKYSQALLQSKGLKVKRVFNSTGILTPEAREAMGKTLTTSYNAAKSGYQQTASEYQRQIDDAYAGRQRTITDYTGGDQPGQVAGASTGPTEQFKMIGGKQYKKVNGGWQAM